MSEFPLTHLRQNREYQIYFTTDGGAPGPFTLFVGWVPRDSAQPPKKTMVQIKPGESLPEMRDTAPAFHEASQLWIEVVAPHPSAKGMLKLVQDERHKTVEVVGDGTFFFKIRK